MNTPIKLNRLNLITKIFKSQKSQISQELLPEQPPQPVGLSLARPGQPTDPWARLRVSAEPLWSVWPSEEQESRNELPQRHAELESLQTDQVRG